MTVRDVKAAIQRGNDSAEEGSKMLRQVKARLTETAALAHETLHDSQDQDASAGLYLLASVGHKLDEAIGILRGAIGRADALARDLG